MRATARLYADQARRQIGKEFSHLATLELLPQPGLAAFVNTVSLEHVLCQVESNCRDRHNG
jgi:hypothetical protein